MTNNDIDNTIIFILLEKKMPTGHHGQKQNPTKTENPASSGGKNDYFDGKENEEIANWSQFLDSIGISYWDYDLNKGWIVFSDTLKMMLGYGKEDIIETMDTWKTLVHPEDVDAVLMTMNEYIAGNTPFFSREYRLLCKNGAYKWILSRGKITKKDKNGKILRISGTHTDISNNKKNEDYLRESEKKFRLLFESVPDGLLLMDLSGFSIIDANQAALNMYGYTRKELLAMTAPELSDEPEKTIAFLNQFSADTQLKKVPSRWHKRKDGSLFPVEIVVGSFTLQNRKLLSAVLHDNSDQLKQNEIIRKMREFFKDIKDFSDVIENEQFMLKPRKYFYEFGITPQEERIIYYLAQGLRNKEVAKKLSIYETTVKTHISSILRKLNLNNRLEIIQMIHTNHVGFSRLKEDN